MTYSNSMSQSKKTKTILFCIEKYGDVCWYDKQPFREDLPGHKRTIDHLNNNAQDNRITNLVLCHELCQSEKKTNIDWQLLARDQLAKNEADPNFLKIEGDRESEREKNGYAQASTDELTDGDVNRIINKTASTYLSEKLPEGKDNAKLDFNDAAASITYLVQKETNGRGSKTAILRALEVQCCSIADFQIIKDKRPFYICRRKK